MPAMRAEAEKGEPLQLVDGRGNNLGQYCITTITDIEKNFIGEGKPRRIDFTMQLELYGEDAVPVNKGGGGSWLWGLIGEIVS